MKLDFTRIEQTKLSGIRSYFLYSDQESYLQFCTTALVEKLQSLYPKVRIERHNLSDIIADSTILQNQGDLFTPAGDPKIILVEEIKDKAAALVKDFLAKDHDQVYLIFPCMMGSSVKQLKAQHEKSPDAAMLACYLSNNRNQHHYINFLASSYDLQLDGEAMAYVLQCLTTDPTTITDDFFKLSLYLDDTKTVTLDDVKCCLSPISAMQLSPLIAALGDRNKAQVTKLFLQIKQNGVEDIQLLRVVSAHFVKLLDLKTRVSSGESVQDALKAVRPLIFFQHYDTFRRHLSGWTEAGILQVLRGLKQAEFNFKTGHPAATTQLNRMLLVVTQIRKR